MRWFLMRQATLGHAAFQLGQTLGERCAQSLEFIELLLLTKDRAIEHIKQMVLRRQTAFQIDQSFFQIHVALLAAIPMVAQKTPATAPRCAR